LPHPPQFFGSICESTHDPEHAIDPGPQTSAHAPLLQTSAFVVSHVVPHAPQLVGSVLVLVHDRPHCVRGALQLVEASLGASADASFCSLGVLEDAPPQAPLMAMATNSNGDSTATDGLNARMREPPRAVM
jgi:hypothetical protein